MKRVHQGGSRGTASPAGSALLLLLAHCQQGWQCHQAIRGAGRAAKGTAVKRRQRPKLKRSKTKTTQDYLQDATARNPLLTFLPTG